MRRLSYIALLTCILISGVSFPVMGQCDDEDFLDDCAAELGDYRFIKSYNSNFSKSGRDEGVIEFSYVFSKGTNYVITICNQGVDGEKMIVELYDRNRKKIGSSYNSKTRKHYPKIGYTCAATGVYYIKTKIKGQKGGCGVCIIGFKK